MVTLITGASSGLGTTFARRYAADGHDLVLVARRRDRLETLARTLRHEHGVTVDVIVADLSAVDAAARLHEETTRLGLHVDTLVNNAGFATYGDLVTADPERTAQEVRLNCVTLTELTARYLPAMVQAGTGTVVTVGSTASFQPVPHMAVYGATKAFVLSFTQALWAELRGTGVRVLALCPGPTETEFFDAIGKDAAVGRMRSPEQVVDTAVRALRTSRPIVVDGVGNRLVAWLAPRLPRRMLVTITARLTRPTT